MSELKMRFMRGLYAITPDGMEREALLLGVEATLRGGTKVVQYREKKLDDAQRTETARALCALCRRFGAYFIVNDSLPLALSVGADGLHLGGDDGDLAAARKALGPARLLGASCYADFELARSAVIAGADYVAFGAVYPSPTKPYAARASLSLLSQCRNELRVPSCAIGGITLDNAPALIAAGADFLAVITDLFGASDVEERARAFQRLFSGEQA